MRLFVAIQLPDDLKSQIAHWMNTLAREIPDPERRLRWVKEDQLHLTLKFLGETSEDRLPTLTKALRNTAERHSPFSLSLAKLGHFGGRVVWLGLESGTNHVVRLANSIEDACGSLGFNRETHAFHPHLTLARSKINPKTIRLSRLPPSILDHVFGPFMVTGVGLIQSTLTPQGSLYNTRGFYPFKK